MAGAKKPQLNVSMGSRDRWLLDVIAAARGISVAALVRDLIEEYLRAEQVRPEIANLIAAAETLRRKEDRGSATVTPLRPSNPKG